MTPGQEPDPIVLSGPEEQLGLAGDDASQPLEFMIWRRPEWRPMAGLAQHAIARSQPKKASAGRPRGLLYVVEPQKYCDINRTCVSWACWASISAAHHPKIDSPPGGRSPFGDNKRQILFTRGFASHVLLEWRHQCGNFQPEPSCVVITCSSS